MAEVEFGLLGPLLVRSDGETVRIPPGKQRALLAALLLSAGQLVSTVELCDVLWGSAPPVSARATVQNYIKRLRQALADTGGSRIGTLPRGYVIAVAADELDVLRFEAAAERAGAAARQGAWEQTAADLRAALSLWRGEPLADVPSELLALREVPRLTEMRLLALESRIEADLHRGQPTSVIAELRQLTAAHPLRERLHGLLMLALYRGGQQADALAAYQRARRVLVEELGTEPGFELRLLEQQILTADPVLAVAVLRELPAVTAIAEPRGTPAPAPGGGATGETGGGQATGPTAGTCGTGATGTTNGTGATGAAGGTGEAVNGTPSPAPSGALRRAPVPVPRQLLAPVRHFAGRAGELRALTSLLDQAAEESPQAVVISAIGGTAGVGKTALALHWAHQVAHRFPDGQLYVNLRGFDPSGTPAEPAEVIRRFLDALRVPAHQVPSSEPGQQGLYRSLLADRRVLIVLDNARDSAQVRPLIPGGSACLVLVTSRNQLTSLVVAEGAHPVTLDVLSRPEARELLARRLGPARIAAEPGVATELTELCARLPLAVAIAAARAAMYPRIPLATLVAELRDASGPLDALDAGEAGSNVRTVLSWSYQHLTAPAARMFRLLGVHPGPDITAAAAASLAGIRPAQARQALNELAQANLLSQPTLGRFTFHDLLRAYAAERASTEDTETERREAAGRAGDHYLHTAHAAALVLHPHRDAITLGAAEDGVTPERIAGYEQAMAWFEAEQRVLLAVVDQAARDGFDTHAWQLALTLTTFFDRHGYSRSYPRSQRTALAAAQRLGDREAQALVHRSLGHVSVQLGAYSDALRHYEQALELYRQLGDRAGQGRILIGLGFTHERQGQYSEALAYCAAALDVYTALGDRPRQASTVNNVGWCHVLLGHYEDALGCCQQAIDLHQELGDRHGEASAWDSLGYAHFHLGQHAQAVACYQQALERFWELGDRRNQADILTHLGDAHQTGGDQRLAREAWQQALLISDELRLPDGDELRARLQPGGPHPANVAQSR